MIIDAYEALNTSTVTARTVHGMSAEEWCGQGLQERADPLKLCHQSDMKEAFGIHVA